MLPGERHIRIIELLNQNKSISVVKLCQILEASEATIRRDLTHLENEGKLERTHGGAILKNEYDIISETSYEVKEELYISEKHMIASKGFEQIEENDSIILDAGTTVLELARLIGQSKLKLNVVTNSTTVARAIGNNKNVSVFMIGGHVRLNTLATVGSYAVDTIKKFNVNKTFIGVNGISLDKGLTTPDVEEAEMKHAMIFSGRNSYVLADHSKFHYKAMCTIAPMAMVNYIITDRGLSDDDFMKFSSDETKIIRC